MGIGILVSFGGFERLRDLWMRVIQCVTDGLTCGTGYQDHEVYFNGCTQDDIHSSHKNGTHGKYSSL